MSRTAFSLTDNKWVRQQETMIGDMHVPNLLTTGKNARVTAKIISEASEGEMRLMDSNEASSRLREQLGLASHTHRQSVVVLNRQLAILCRPCP
jgi:hypothetical protein